tara:strand:+ start:477 stop:1022 length:546 start_codon:yes stop_codon:yes gene_type:complete
MFPNLNTVEVKETTNYLPEGVHTLKIDSVSNSNQKEGYTGIPYVEFKTSNKDGVAFLKFNGVEDTTSPKAAEIRTSIFKGFLTNAGATSFDNLPKACKEVVGKTLNVCLASREYWTNDKDTGQPVVKSIVEYKFSNPEGKSIMWKNSYNKKLSPTDQAAYQAAYNAYVGDNTVDNNTDLPF